MTHGYNWGQTIDLFTNQFATNRVQYDNFYLSGSVVLFSGLRNYYDIRTSQLNFESSELSRQIFERNVKIDVSAAYLQSLLNRELLEISRNNLERSLIQLNTIEELFNVNQKTSIDVQEVVAQVEMDKYNVIKAVSDLKLSLMLLQNLMNRQYEKGFEIAAEINKNLIDSSGFSSIDSSLFDLPEVILIDLGLEKQLLLVKSAKSRYYPSVSLNGSLGSGYSENNKVLTDNGEYLPRPFSEQMNNNLYQSVYFTFNIPLFNKSVIRNQVKVKELEMKSFQFEKEYEINQLQFKLQNLSLEIINLDNQVTALQSVYESALLNYKNFDILYNTGNITNLQLTEAKDKLSKTESDLVQARYQLMFKEIVLGFYFQ